MIKEVLKEIPYNIPTLCGNEGLYLKQVIENQSFSGNNSFSKRCQNYFKEKFYLANGLLTSSCSLALEIAASLCELDDQSEVIIPSFAYLTIPSIFQKTGAKIIFADVDAHHPNISPNSISEKISARTKVVLIIHYAGIACDMDKIIALKKQFGFILIEDCAHSIGVKYHHQPIGSFGDFASFSFHETKNIHCGEGGLLVINNNEYLTRAKRIWAEGSNRSDFEAGLTEKYEWVSLGSSYQPSEFQAAFLLAQLEHEETIRKDRLKKWMYYYQKLNNLSPKYFSLPPYEKDISDTNAHIFYIKLQKPEDRSHLISFLEEVGVSVHFHYLPLHLSPFWLQNHPVISIPEAENWSKSILRLPLYYQLTKEEQEIVINALNSFYSSSNHLNS